MRISDWSPDVCASDLRDPLRDRNLSEGRQRMSDDARALADPGRLSAWLDAYIPALGGGPLAVEKIHGGTSKVILSLNRGAQPLKNGRQRVGKEGGRTCRSRWAPEH